MPRGELNTDKLGPIDQRKTVATEDTTADHEGEVVTVERIDDMPYMDALAFMEEPVTIRLEPSADKNAAQHFPVWVNGKPAEVFMHNRWVEMGWLPVSTVLTVKRKTVEIILRAKVDTVTTDIQDRTSERPKNIVHRFTTPVASFSILDDKNPRGAAWATEMHRRYM